MTSFYVYIMCLKITKITQMSRCGIYRLLCIYRPTIKLSTAVTLGGAYNWAETW